MPTASQEAAAPIKVKPKGTEEPPLPNALSHASSEPQGKHIKIPKAAHHIEKMQTQTQIIDKVQD